MAFLIVLMAALIGIASTQSISPATTTIRPPTTQSTTPPSTIQSTISPSTTPSTTSTSSRPTTPSTTRPPTTPITWIDPYLGGKQGNPGARAFVCKKSMDAVHDYVSDMISRAILGMTVSDLSIPVGSGTIVVQPPRVTKAIYANNQYSMVPPNRIRSRFFDGQLEANGVWVFKPYTGDLMGGTYKAFIQTELTAINQLGRTTDAKPTIQPVECKANISHFRIQVQGSGHVKEIENCDFDFCHKIRKFFEDTICQLFDAFVKEVLNRYLQHVPNRMNIQGEQYRIDYGLLMGEPTVNDTCIKAGMEGKYMWRGLSGVPFNAPDMQWMDRGRMFSFQISDFPFNTLLHHVQGSGMRFSAADLESSTIQQMLSLNCDDESPTPTTTTTPKPTARRFRIPAFDGLITNRRATFRNTFRQPKCLGSLFSNLTNLGPFSVNDTGDVVYKIGQKAPTIYIESEKRSFFDSSSGLLEFYGPVGRDGNRPLLVRTDVRVWRGDFKPKLNKINITGSMKTSSIRLELSSQSTGIFRSISPDWLPNVAQFVKPILNELFNTWFDRFAQFPMPLPKKFKCTSPDFTITHRSLQIDCDISCGKSDLWQDSASSSRSGESEDEDDDGCKCFRNTCVCN